MKPFIKSIALTIALLPLSVMAKSYYVSTSGNDNNSGSLKAPFKTIAQATSKMKAGDECVIMEGVYHEVIKSQQSGTKSKPILYKNYNDDQVIIDASETIDGWVKHSGNIYKTKKQLPSEVSIYNTLFYNNEILDIARWPNNADADRFTFDGYRVDGGSASHFEVTGLPEGDLTGGYFCYLGAHSGTSWSRRINDYKDGEIHFNAVDINRWPYTPHNPTILRNKNYGQLYLFGKLELLDQPGEWYYDSANETIYAMFPDQKAPAKGSVKGGVRATTMEIDHDYIIVDGLNCFGGEVRVNGSYCTFKNGEYRNCSQTYEGLIDISAQSGTATFMIRGGNIVIENNLIEGGMASGIVISPLRGERRARPEGARPDGVRPEGARPEAVANVEEKSHYTIHNNVIRYFNTIGIHAKAINSHGDYTTITNNTIYTCGRDAITTSGKWNEIAYNDMFDCMRINNDGGIYYTVGNTELKETKIHHNYWHDSYGPSYADGRAAGIYLDNNSKGYEVYNNVIWNVTWSALMFNWYNTDFDFYNNTIWDCGFNMGRWENGYIIEKIRVFNNFANITIRDKLVQERASDAKGEWIGTEFGTNLILTESPFVSAEGRDFRPAAGSPLVDAGDVIEGFSKGYKGEKPEIGAYELGEELWSVGASWASEVMPKDFKYGNVRSGEEIEGQSESEDDIFKKR